MRFLVDQQLPPALAHWLGQKGHDADHVFLLGLGESDDSDLWRHAAANNLIVVSKDSDFAERRLRSNDGPTIIWLRVGNTTNAVLFALLEDHWAAIEIGLAGASSVIEVR